MAIEDDEMLTVTDVINELRIHRSTWQKLVSAGDIPTIVKIGNVQRIRRGALREWLKQNEAKSQAA